MSLVSMTKIELRNNKLKNHKNTLEVKAKGDLCEIKELIKTFLHPFHYFCGEPLQ